MKEMLDAGVIKPLHNKKLEAEYYAGCVLMGYRYDKNYLDLIMYLSDLPLIILQNNIQWNTQIKVIYDLFYEGDSVIWGNNPIKGKEKQLKIALQILKPLAQDYFSTFATEHVYLEAHKQMMMYDNYQKALGTSDIGFVIDNTDEYYYKDDEDTRLNQLKKFVFIADAILDLIDRVDFNKTYTKVSFKKDLISLRLYIDETNIYLQTEGTNTSVSLVLGYILTWLVAGYPNLSEKLDPYHVDSFTDAFDIMSYPAKLYINLISDKVVNPVLCQVISGCYPESYQVMVDKLLKSLDSFDLDKQNRLKMYSGAFETDTLLVQQVNNALMKGYAQNVT